MGTVIDILNVTVPFYVFERAVRAESSEHRGLRPEWSEQSRDLGLPHCRSMEAAGTQKWVISVRSWGR